ncbi:MAG: GtrA family protein [Gammaproteobacteria bacterium]|nr:GtrA family protein [Gammaproteobacteria bacterium]
MKTHLIEKFELFLYTLIGGVATIVDWSVFAICINWFGIHYEAALVLAYSAASIAHFSANKSLTFKCESKDYVAQLSIYILVLAISLGLSMTIMAILVKYFVINKVLLRIATTIIMLVPNYLLHKHITFSKRIFTQPQTP